MKTCVNYVIEYFNQYLDTTKLDEQTVLIKNGSKSIGIVFRTMMRRSRIGWYIFMTNAIKNWIERLLTI